MGTCFAVTNNPNFDYYGTDIKFHSFNNFGFDLVYQADSNQAVLLQMILITSSFPVRHMVLCSLQD